MLEITHVIYLLVGLHGGWGSVAMKLRYRLLGNIPFMESTDSSRSLTKFSSFALQEGIQSLEK